MALAPLPVRGVAYVDPDDALGIWDFNQVVVGSQSADLMQGTPLVFQAGAAFSADAGGRSGLAGDRAMNLGTVAGNSALVTDQAFLALLNLSCQTQDQLTVVFWQKWSTTVANSSSVWLTSASASGTNRGFQGHVPWGDGSIFFDTSGCCASPTQRLNGAVSGVNWQAWQHVALVKNGGAKEVWVNGTLRLSQASGASALPADFTNVRVGQLGTDTGSTVRGWIDDFAIFGTALDAAQIAALAAGTAPAELVVPPENRPPQVANLLPADGTLGHPVTGGIGFTATTLAPNSIAAGGIRLFVNGAEVTAGLAISGTATNRVVSYATVLQPGQFYSVRAEVTDNAARSTVRDWTFDTVDPATNPTHPPLALSALGTPRAASLASGSSAAFAIDGNAATISETANQPGAFWEIELQRTVPASRIYLVAPTGAGYSGVLTGAVVRVFDLRDQLIHESTIGTVTPGGTWAVILPAGTVARIVRVELPAGQTNGAGDYRIALADLRILGDPSPAYGPLDLAATATATQSTTAGSNTAALAIDANAATFSETTDALDSHWLLKLDRDRPVSRVELVNRADANATRLAGLTLRLLDAQSTTLATTTVTNPGAGATWGFDVPPGTAAVRYVRIGLEGGAVNGQGNRIVSLAGVSVFSGVNYALGTPAYMVRLHDGLPPAANANDGNYATHTETTTQTTDGYWETDLGTTRSLYSVRAVAFDSGDNQIRLRHATLRLFDENHESVFSEHLSGTSANFDIALPGPVSARYVRVGFENKERSSLTGGTEWYLRLREVQAFGRPLAETGLTGFSAAATELGAGQSTTLTWQEEDLRDLTLYPGGGSVGAYVDPQGTGTLTVTPATSTEYILVGTNHNGPVTRHVTIQVDGQPLPVRISEFMASNRLSLRDGFNDSSDWIELHNPNATALDLTGYGLSDNPAQPMKWVFPAGSVIAPHGYRIVFASGRSTGLDAQGFLHTDFSLSATSESVVLTAPDGLTTVDAVLNYPTQREDLAYGRSLAGDWAFLQPTPAAVNLTGPLAGWLEPPTFSHSRGFYDSSFTLTLSNPNPGAELLYSVDGTEPSLPYAGPLQVTGSLAVRAAVRRAGYQSPRTETHTYIFRNSVMTSPLMNTTYTQGALATRLRNSLTQLPSICVSVPEISGDYTEREASLEVFLPDGTPPLQMNAGFTRVGGSWTDFAKRSYRLSFRPEYGARKLETPLLRGFDRGMPVLDELDTLDLTAGNHDMAQRGFYMSNRFVEDTMLEMGSLNPHGRFVHVYLNGTYWGQYNAHERLEDSFLAGYLGGKAEDYVNVRGNDNYGGEFVTGTPEPPNRALWETVRANRGSYAVVKTAVDVPQLIDFMLAWFYGNCESEFRCAGPIAPGSGFKFWMADADGFLRTPPSDTTGNAGPGGIFGALAAEGHPDFKMLLADRIYRHFFNNGAMTPDRNLARLNARMTEIQDSLIAECARWGYRTPDNWESAAQSVRTGMFPVRTGNLFTQLKNRGFYPAIDPPVLAKHGGSVPEGYQLTFSSGAGTIYYTLNGSDPRLPGGGVAPGAIATSASQSTSVTTGSAWRFWDKGSVPAANWQTSAYSDTAWASGTAPLGYGGGQTTTISYGGSSSNKYITSYFRRTFNVADPAAVTGLSVGVIRDDGAVIYLNGVEVARSNMPATGTIGYSTLASGTVSGDNKYLVNTFSVPANLLVAGANLLAVEVHQSGATSGDLLFDLSLTEYRSPSVALSQNTTVKARLLNGGTWSALADATFHVAHPLLTGGPYVFSHWAPEAAAGSYPQAMRLFQTDVIDPPLTAAMTSSWTLPYNLTSRSRINGLGSDGLAFINTGNVQTTPGAGFVGAAVVALNTTGTQDIRVTWTGGTVQPNDRDYGIRLQYRVGETGAFLDVPAAGGGPVEYLRNPLSGHAQVIGPVTLPPAAENQPLVELRWKYYFRSGSSGARPQLRLDDIQVTAGPVVPETLALLDFPVTAQAGATCGPVAVQVRGRNGAIADDYTGLVTLSLPGHPGLLGGTLTRQALNGGVVFDDLVFLQPGTYTFTAEAAGLTAATSGAPTRVLGLTELVVPRFIQGAQPENNQRVPFACLLRVEGLLPNATYRYANQLVNDDDSPTQEGAGNMIFTGDSFIRSTDSPRFLAGDLNVRHGEFVADAQGRHTGWFVAEPTSNPRFSPGGTLWVRILLNDGTGSESAAHYLTAAGPVAVLGFGSGSGEGSAVYGESGAAARNFVVLYEDTAGAGRPLAATPVEATGMVVDSRYAAFYQAMVAGQPGRWGTLVPNGLTSGVRRIEERDLATGDLVAVFTSPAGNRPTTGLASGVEPVGLWLPPADASGFARWQAGRFTLAELREPAVGGPLGDADGDGTANLLEYGFGMDPLAAAVEGLPVTTLETVGGNPQLVFRYRRLLADPGLSYRVEASPEMQQWQDAAGTWLSLPEAEPNPDGITETVTCRMAVAPGLPTRFLRVQVGQP
jgi:hypothetical protein